MPYRAAPETKQLSRNVDSETEGVFTVGCAGGRHTHIHKELALEKLPDSNELFKITVPGLKGGHSGIDIHRQRANANKILGRALDHINAAYFSQPTQFGNLKAG